MKRIEVVELLRIGRYYASVFRELDEQGTQDAKQYMFMAEGIVNSLTEIEFHRRTANMNALDRYYNIHQDIYNKYHSKIFLEGR